MVKDFKLNREMTIGEVYNPLIKYAKNNDSSGYDYLIAVGQLIFENNKDRCKSLQEGIEQAKVNLDYYCQYFGEDDAVVVKKFYELGEGFRSLRGKTDIPMNAGDTK